MKKIFSEKRSLLPLFSLLILFQTFISCSLDYEEKESPEAKVPEIIFSNATFSRYEGGSVKMQMQSEKLEQYKTDSATFGKNVTFKTWNNKGEISNTGKSDFLGMSNENGVYTLFGNIEILYNQDNTSIKADSLRWNEKTEQLTSGEDDSVTIKRDDLELRGKGFSASGISKKYSFSGYVEGILTPKEKDAESTEEKNKTANSVTPISSSSKPENPYAASQGGRSR